MDKDIRKIVERLHDQPDMVVAAVAGAGAQFISWLLETPGASRTLLEAVIPYSTPSLAELLGAAPEKSASERTSIDMARSAYRRAVGLRRAGTPVMGLGGTAAIATDRTKRGDHRCYAAVWRPLGVVSYGLVMAKGARDRGGEEELASRLMLRALAESCGIDADLPLRLGPGENVASNASLYRDPIEALCGGHVETVTIGPDGGMAADETFRGGVLPGSFNPLHRGHESLASAASEMLGERVIFELSIANVDKPSLEEEQVRYRAAQFAGKRSLVLTTAPTFHRKAMLFRGSSFIIGWDTAVRLVDPRYYDGSESKMLVDLERIRAAGCRFLVAGRAEGDRLHTLADVAVPRGFEDMFAPIPESAFRCDLSSSQLRLSGRSV